MMEKRNNQNLKRNFLLLIYNINDNKQYIWEKNLSCEQKVSLI